jgi:hypothetical protein
MPSSRFMASSFPTTAALSAGRLMAPSTTAEGNAAPTGATAAPPCEYSACTIASASTMGTPRAASMDETADLPAAGGGRGAGWGQGCGARGR